MKKTGLEVTTAAFALILILARIPLKLFFIDPFTGFYLRENMLGTFFNITFFILLGLCFFNAERNKKDYEGKMRVGATRCTLFSLSSIAITVVSGLNLMALSDVEFGCANEVPKFLIYPAHILGIAAGLLMLFLSCSLFSGAVVKRGAQLLSLVIPVWCALLSLADFLSYRFTVYASDELIGTIFMLSSIMMFLYISKSLIIPEEGKKYLFFASATFLTGTVLSVPQLAAILLLKKETGGPGILSCIMTLAVSVIALCFLFPPSRKMEKD